MLRLLRLLLSGDPPAPDLVPDPGDGDLAWYRAELDSCRVRIAELSADLADARIELAATTEERDVLKRRVDRLRGIPWWSA